MTTDKKFLEQSCETVKLEDAGLSEAEIFLQSYPLLREKSKNELDRLNKAVILIASMSLMPALLACNMTFT